MIFSKKICSMHANMNMHVETKTLCVNIKIIMFHVKSHVARGPKRYAHEIPLVLKNKTKLILFRRH